MESRAGRKISTTSETFTNYLFLEFSQSFLHIFWRFLASPKEPQCPIPPGEKIWPLRDFRVAEQIGPVAVSMCLFDDAFTASSLLNGIISWWLWVAGNAALHSGPAFVTVSAFWLTCCRQPAPKWMDIYLMWSRKAILPPVNPGLRRMPSWSAAADLLASMFELGTSLLPWNE